MAPMLNNVCNAVFNALWSRTICCQYSCRIMQCTIHAQRCNLLNNPSIVLHVSFLLLCWAQQATRLFRNESEKQSHQYPSFRLFPEQKFHEPGNELSTLLLPERTRRPDSRVFHMQLLAREIVRALYLCVRGCVSVSLGLFHSHVLNKS
jgi:hypothetical protein